MSPGTVAVKHKAQKTARRKEIGNLSAPLGGATLHFLRRTPGHALKGFNKVNELAVIERAGKPAVKRADKAAAVRNQAVHRIADCGMFMAAGVKAVVLSKAGEVVQVWYSRTHRERNYTPCKV